MIQDSRACITEVKLSDDLSSAKIFLNYLNQALNEDQDDLSKALENSKPFVKKKLGQNIKLKKLPELFFFIDQRDTQFDIWIVSLE